MASPRIGKFSTSSTVTWASGALFNGFCLVGIAKPTISASPVHSVSYGNSGMSEPIPDFYRIPIVDGKYSQTCGLFYTADLTPPGAVYYAWLYVQSAQGNYIPVTAASSSFTVSSDSITPPSFTVSNTATGSQPTPDQPNTDLVIPPSTYTLTGNVDAAGYDITGIDLLGATTGTFSGALTGTSGTFSGTVGAGALTSSGTISGASASIGTIVASGGLFRVESTTPEVGWYETDATTDEKRWKIYPSGGDLNFVTVNDSDATAVTWLKNTRIGNKVDECQFTTGQGIRITSDNSSERQIICSNDGTNYYYQGRRAADGYYVISGNQAAPAAGFVVALATLERIIVTPSRFWIRPGTLPAYANNAAAIGGGLSAGDLYQVSGTDPRQIAMVF